MKVLGLMILGCLTVCAAEKFEMTVLNPECCAGGAGLCVVMRTPEGKTFLYDTANGEPTGRELRNNGRDIIVPWLLAHGIDRVDGLIISHGHNDHMGGLHWMNGNYDFGMLWDNGYILQGTDPKDYKSEMGAYHKIRDEYAAAHPDKYKAVTAGDMLDFGCKDLKVEVVWPPKGYVGVLENEKRMKGDGPEHHLENANAIALQVTYKKIKFFIVGDIQEDYLAARMVKVIPPEKWRSDICLMPSHGIHASKLDAELIRPKLAIGGIGDLPWMFGPYSRDVKVYGAVGAKVLITNREGDVTVTTDGETFDVTTEPAAFIRTKEWALMPEEITLGGWVRALSKFSHSRGPRRWCEADAVEAMRHAEAQVQVYLCKGTTNDLVAAEAVATKGFAVPARSLPAMMARPILESDAVAAWVRLNVALLRATAQVKYAQNLQATFENMRSHDVSPDALALAHTFAVAPAQHIVYFNLLTDFTTERLHISAPWHIEPSFTMTSDGTDSFTLRIQHSSPTLRGNIPLKFVVPAQFKNFTLTGLENVKHTSSITPDGYLTVSATWPVDCTFTVKYN